MEWNIVLPNLRSKNPIIKKINDYVLQNLSQEISLEDMSKVSGVSTFYLCRLFKKELKITPIKWLWTQRVMAAAAYLKTNSHFSLTDVAFACGFTSSAHFSRLFKSTYGIKPSHFRRQYKNEVNINEREILEEGQELIPQQLRSPSEDVMENISLIDYSLY